MPTPLNEERKAMASTTPSGPYTVWVNHRTEGWHWTDYETLEEALWAEKYSTFVIQKPVKIREVLYEGPLPQSRKEGEE